MANKDKAKVTEKQAVQLQITVQQSKYPTQFNKHEPTTRACALYSNRVHNTEEQGQRRATSLASGLPFLKHRGAAAAASVTRIIVPS